VVDDLHCGWRWYDQHIKTVSGPSDEEVNVACREERELVMAELANLTSALEKSRRYAWTGWDSPQSLKDSLGMKANNP